MPRNIFPQRFSNRFAFDFLLSNIFSYNLRLEIPENPFFRFFYIFDRDVVVSLDTYVQSNFLPTLTE